MANKSVQLEAIALILHKTYIKKGTYRFTDPTNHKWQVVLTLADCGGVSLKVGNTPRSLADESTMKLATAYSLECRIDIDEKLNLFPSKENPHDWPRSSDGRQLLEDTFLRHMNYFTENILYLSDQHNDNHQLLGSVRPIGTEDIISIDFKLNKRKVAAQGNSILRLIAMRFDDKSFWPKTTHITRLFGKLSAESKLLLRACALINTGFYSEALLTAFSVLDAKTQELVEIRAFARHTVDRKITNRYLRNISQDRMGTMLNFLMKCIDNVSLTDTNPTLFKEFEKINTKRNRIIHNGDDATRTDATNAVSTVAEILLFYNTVYKAKFNVPRWLLLPGSHGGPRPSHIKQKKTCANKSMQATAKSGA